MKKVVSQSRLAGRGGLRSVRKHHQIFGQRLWNGLLTSLKVCKVSQ